MGDSRSSAVLGFPLALGLIVGLIGGGRYIAQAADIWQQSSRTVTVRGLAEREIPADLALWPLNYTVDTDTLGELQEGLDRDRQRIKDFLIAADFDETDISVTTPRITDQARNTYGDRRPELRYSAEATVLLRSRNDLDSYTPEIKRVRAVTTVDYALEQ